MVELWVSAYRLSDVNISLSKTKIVRRAQKIRRNMELRADRRTDVLTDEGHYLSHFALRWGFKALSLSLSLSLSLPHLIRFSRQLEPNLLQSWARRDSGSGFLLLWRQCLLLSIQRYSLYRDN